jgi:hypothetical protein
MDLGRMGPLEMDICAPDDRGVCAIENGGACWTSEKVAGHGRERCLNCCAPTPREGFQCWRSCAE